jgi:hypothetical protein
VRQELRQGDLVRQLDGGVEGFAAVLGEAP